MTFVMFVMFENLPRETIPTSSEAQTTFQLIKVQKKGFYCSTGHMWNNFQTHEQGLADLLSIYAEKVSHIHIQVVSKDT